MKFETYKAQINYYDNNVIEEIKLPQSLEWYEDCNGSIHTDCHNYSAVLIKKGLTEQDIDELYDGDLMITDLGKFYLLLIEDIRFINEHPTICKELYFPETSILSFSKNGVFEQVIDLIKYDGNGYFLCKQYFVNQYNRNDVSINRTVIKISNIQFWNDLHSFNGLYNEMYKNAVKDIFDYGCQVVFKCDFDAVHKLTYNIEQSFKDDDSAKQKELLNKLNKVINGEEIIINKDNNE